MTVAARSDLATAAGRRARLAALLGRLLLEEPGPDIAELVEGVPELKPLGQTTPDLAAEYERLLLRQIPPYESVFLGDDGESAAVAAPEQPPLDLRALLKSRFTK